MGGYWLADFLLLRFDISYIIKVFYYIGIIAGVIVPILGYLSYPRVHNLKVFLAGYLTGTATLAYFLLGSRGFLSSSIPLYFIPGLYLLMITVIFISTVLPTFVKYRHTKIITVIMLLLEICFIYLLRTNRLPLESLCPLRQFKNFQWLNITPAVIMLLTLLLSFRLLKLQFHLGGVMGGTMLLFSGGWYIGALCSHPSIFDAYIFATAPLFLGIGIFVHWIARIEHRASYDPLLRIYNRSYCEKVLAEQTMVKTSPPFGIAMVDIDHFKKVNDTYGHRAGDEVLIRVARILTAELVPGGIVCRYGGEEFVIFFPRKNSTRVKATMEKVRKSIKATVIHYKKKTIKITISIGVSHRQNTSQKLNKVLESADRALYRAKKQGRNQVRVSKVS